jgi:VIT1/CCC1 family predicted Fe2+/Mn2+ transporter
MAAGEYVSMRAHRELLERELKIESRELTENPDAELAELAAIYRHRGVPADLAKSVAVELMRAPDLALQTHARDELGIDPDELGSARLAALSSFAAFSVGAAIPLVPLLLLTGFGAAAAALVCAAVGALVIGAALSAFTGRSRIRTALRQLGITAGVSAGGYAIGVLIGSGLGG